MLLLLWATGARTLKIWLLLLVVQFRRMPDNPIKPLWRLGGKYGDVGSKPHSAVFYGLLV